MLKKNNTSNNIIIKSEYCFDEVLFAENEERKENRTGVASEQASSGRHKFKRAGLKIHERICSAKVRPMKKKDFAFFCINKESSCSQRYTLTS